jgi:glycosyltransferase involved in cell wall biosynthesis
MELVLMTTQIGHYHDARFRAVAKVIESFCVLVTQNTADFSQLLASEDPEYPTVKLFQDGEGYYRAIQEGRIWRAVSDALDALDPRVVCVPGWASPESFSAIAWARKHRRSIVTLSESQEQDANRRRWRERIKSRVVRLSDAALVGGGAHRDYAIKLGLPRKNVFLGYDAVDNQHFQRGSDIARENDESTRKRLGLPHRYLLASARFIEKKNLPNLISAYACAREVVGDVPDLVVLGDGPVRARIESMVRELGLEQQVQLPGFFGYVDLPALYGLSEGFVHVSLSEQWGLVINEAAASGIPVIASSACGATASLVVPECNGFIVNPWDVSSISEALQKISSLSSRRRANMGLASRQLVADWGLERFTEGFFSAYQCALTQPARGILPWDLALLRALSRRSITDVQ